jgi:hypothetical protein
MRFIGVIVISVQADSIEMLLIKKAFLNIGIESDRNRVIGECGSQHDVYLFI